MSGADKNFSFSNQQVNVAQLSIKWFRSLSLFLAVALVTTPQIFARADQYSAQDPTIELVSVQGSKSSTIEYNRKEIGASTDLNSPAKKSKAAIRIVLQRLTLERLADSDALTTCQSQVGKIFDGGRQIKSVRGLVDNENPVKTVSYTCHNTIVNDEKVIRECTAVRAMSCLVSF